MVESNERFAGTGELSTPEAASTETVEEPKEATEGETQDTDGELDYKTLYEASQVDKTKLTNDLNAVRTGNMKQRERDDLLTDIRNRLDTTEQVNLALVNALNSGETEALPGQLQDIQGKATQARTTSRLQVQYDAMSEQLNKAVLDRDGKPLLDLKTAPELQEAASRWAAASDSGDVGTLASVVFEVKEIALAKERDNHTKALAERDKKAEEERKKLLDGKSAMDTDSGPGGGSTSSGLKGVARMAKALENKG